MQRDEPRRLLGSGREAEVFSYGDGTVLKLLRDGVDPARADDEALVLEALESAGYEAPRLRGLVTVEGRRGLVMTRVGSRDLFAALARNPFRLRTVARVLARRQADLHDVIAPDQLPAQHDVVRQRIEAAAAISGNERDALVQLLGGLEGGDRLCHGDLHPGNLVAPLRNPVPIDWGGASRGPPIADVARTQLLLREGVVPDGAPLVLRRLAPVLRRALADQHLRFTRQLRPLDADVLDRWMVVWAAARLAEPVEPEHPALLVRVQAGLRRYSNRWE